MKRFYTAEAVTEGYPDKVCDQIADAILDECLRNNEASKVACEETPQLMPMPVVLANRIVRELSAGRKSSCIQGILPDGKVQVTVEYKNEKPVRLDSVVVSCQHIEEKISKAGGRDPKDSAVSGTASAAAG